MKFHIVKVVEVSQLRGYCLRVAFSDGSIGEHDFSGLFDEPGPMIEPLRDPAFFSRVFVEMGALAWPNGFDMDAIKLHMDMTAAGELKRDAAE